MGEEANEQRVTVARQPSDPICIGTHTVLHDVDELVRVTLPSVPVQETPKPSWSGVEVAEALGDDDGSRARARDGDPR